MPLVCAAHSLQTPALSVTLRLATAVTPRLQAAGRSVSYHTFQHVLSLDITYHLHRRTGAVVRIIARGDPAWGTSAANVLMNLRTALPLSASPDMRGENCVWSQGPCASQTAACLLRCILNLVAVSRSPICLPADTWPRHLGNSAPHMKVLASTSLAAVSERMCSTLHRQPYAHSQRNRAVTHPDFDPKSLFPRRHT